MTINPNHYRLLYGATLLLAIGLLTMVTIADTRPYYRACYLCLMQRKPWWGIMIISVMGLWLGRRYNKLLITLLFLGYLTAFGIATYHSLVEHKVIMNVFECETVIATSIENLPLFPVRCDLPQRLFGIAFTTWHLMYIGLNLLVIALIRRRYLTT